MNYDIPPVNTSGYIAMPLKLAVVVRALRHSFNMSQTELADLAGCSRPTINRIESIDKASPRTDTIERLIQVFRDRGVDVQIGDAEIVLRFTGPSIHSATSNAASADK